MPNPIKYSTGSESLALKKGNFYIGTGDVGKGPTNVTGYYNGITPPTGGYTIYLNKETGGPSIYTASNDAQLISLTNSIASESFTSATQCLVYYASQTDKVVLNRDYEGIVTDGLVLNLDAGFTPSYPQSGTTWYDLSGRNNHGTLINGPTFSGGSIVLDGINDRINVPKDLNGFEHNIQYDIDWTLECWMYTYPHDGSPQHYVGIYGSYNGCNYSALPGNAQGFLIYFAALSAQTFANFSFGPKNTGFPCCSPSQCPDVQFNFSNAETSWYYNDAVNKWCHWVLTSNDGTTYKLYINGTQRGNTKTVDFKNSENRIGNNLTSTSNYSWGGDSTSNSSNQVNFSNCRIYNRPLSESEILQNYNAQKGRFGL